MSRSFTLLTCSIPAIGWIAYLVSKFLDLKKNNFFGFVIVYSKFVFRRPFYQMMEFFKYVNISVLWHQESGVICIFKKPICVRFGLPTRTKYKYGPRTGPWTILRLIGTNLLILLLTLTACCLPERKSDIHRKMDDGRFRFVSSVSRIGWLTVSKALE